MEKERWKDEVLSSLNRIKKAEPKTDLFDLVWEVSQEEKLQPKTIPMPIIRFAAACLLLLMSVNTYVVVKQINTPATVQSEATADGYTNLISNLNLYEE